VKQYKFRQGIKFFFGALIIFYPLLVFSALVIFKLKIQYLSLLLIVLAIAYFIINKQNYSGRHPAFIFISPAILFIIGSLCFVLPFFVESTYFNNILLKIYPALADLVYLTLMGTSLFIPPNLVFSLVNLFDKNLKDHLDKAYYAHYCRRCAIAWCVYFIIDAVICFITSIRSSDLIWAIYNSGITYVIMGLIFAAQYVFIKMIENYVVNVIEKKPETNLEADDE
jgi:uncharacterized membrane protein